jgi:guanylate kinase
MSGSLFIVSAPSGAGKTSLVAALLEEAQLEAGVLRDMARSHILAASA